MRVVVEGQDYHRYAMVAVEFGYVGLELLPDVVVPCQEALRVAAHQADLAVAEDCLGVERGVLCEGLWGFLLEGGDPGGIDGHVALLGGFGAFCGVCGAPLFECRLFL